MCQFLPVWLREVEEEKHLPFFFPFLPNLVTFYNFFLFGLEKQKQKSIFLPSSFFSPTQLHFVTSSQFTAGREKHLSSSFPFLSKLFTFCNFFLFGWKKQKQKSICSKIVAFYNFFPFGWRTGKGKASVLCLPIALQNCSILQFLLVWLAELEEGKHLSSFFPFLYKLV